MIRKLGFVTLAVALATSVHAQDDWGEKPDQAAAEQLAIDVLQTLLKDPYSAHYRWDEIIGTSKWDDRGPPCYGWVLRGHVNAKNSYGGYVGETDYKFYIRNGRVDCAVSGVRMGRGLGTEREARVY